MKKLILILLLLLFTWHLQAQDYEIWGTIKTVGKLNTKWTITAELEDRYNIEAGNIRYFHYDVGALYSINKKIKVGLFYRDIFENKEDVITRVTVPHADIAYSHSGIKLRTRLEYIVKYHDIENKFRLRIRPGYQTSIWDNFNPFIQNELFLTDIDYLARNRFNVGVTIKIGKVKIQPGYLLESNHKDLWTSRNILWINTKVKF